jgi:CRP-like cAMP-binding protein
MVQNSPFLRKIAPYVDLSPDDLNVLATVYNRRRKFEAGRDLILQGQTDPSAFILVSGWACSYVILPNGVRQIIALHIPGDLVGLRSVLFAKSEHSVQPITTVEASELLVADLLDAFARSPQLTMAVLWVASRDVALVVGNLVGMGRRTAAKRTAHLLLELGARLREVCLGDRSGFACPLSQSQLADALGLSAVHVNRVLRNLRESGLVTFQKGQVSFGDFDRLVTFAEFDMDFLEDALAPAFRHRSIAAASLRAESLRAR